MELKLPLSVVSQIDIIRLLRELNALDDFFVSAKVRPAGTSIMPPRITRVIDELAKDNQINLLETSERNKLQTDLKRLLDNAPKMQISFASEPSPRSLQEILNWLRRNIHPAVLVQIGIQPTIAAGCVIRTQNKIFDMSMRNYLKQQEPNLVKIIQGATNGR